MSELSINVSCLVVVSEKTNNLSGLPPAAWLSHNFHRLFKQTQFLFAIRLASETCSMTSDVRTAKKISAPHSACKSKRIHRPSFEFFFSFWKRKVSTRNVIKKKINFNAEIHHQISNFALFQKRNNQQIFSKVSKFSCLKRVRYAFESAAESFYNLLVLLSAFLVTSSALHGTNIGDNLNQPLLTKFTFQHTKSSWFVTKCWGFGEKLQKKTSTFCSSTRNYVSKRWNATQTFSWAIFSKPHI